MYILRLKSQITVLLLCLLCLYYVVLNLFLPERIREKVTSFTSFGTVNLGLDLRGGTHLLFEVDIEDWKHGFINQVLDTTRSLLRNNQIGYSNLSVTENEITLKLREAWQRQKAVSILRSTAQDFKVKVLPSGYLRLSWDQEKQALATRTVVNQSIEVIKRRVNELGTKDMTVQRQGSSCILVQLSGEQDIDHVKFLIGKTAKLTFHIVADTGLKGSSDKTSTQIGSSTLPSDDGYSDSYVIEKQALMGGESLIDAHIGRGQYGQVQVLFRLNRLGGRQFAEVTGSNIGKRLAIVFDGRVISAPVIQDKISFGEGVIVGNFTIKSASDLALLMKSGSLVAPMTIIEERMVGPELGEDSITSGKIAVVCSLLSVGIFMVLLYSFFGLVADIAMIFNLILLMIILSGIKATLTLPGIAGIALTLGMSVDSNVLINERIKEESRKGLGIEISINRGYSRALATIVDSNVTTLIGACSLILFGSGSIKGFGVTLAIGLCSSVFTSVAVTRLILTSWYNRYRPSSLPIFLFRRV